MKTLIKNGIIVTPLRMIKQGAILIKNGKIANIFEKLPQKKWGYEVEIVDAKGCYITPGFIDIHCHGGGGFDFLDDDFRAIHKASQTHMQYGTTSIVPTVMTSSLEVILRSLDHFKKAKQQLFSAPHLLGIHLEGPYLSAERKGAQPEYFIKKPDPVECQHLLDYSNDIIRWTIAPEIPGALTLGRMLKDRNILVSIGHTQAEYQDIVKAYENGFSHFTHFYSAMSGVHKKKAFRYAGAVEAGYLIDEITLEIIADGRHLPAPLLKLILKIKGPDKVCLITDAMRAAGMPPGEYVLGNQKEGQKVIIEDEVAKLKDRSALAGSIATANRLLRNIMQLADANLKDAVKMLTLTPARIIGIADHKGILAPGKDADVVVFNDQIDIQLVMVNGQIKINHFGYFSE